MTASKHILQVKMRAGKLAQCVKLFVIEPVTRTHNMEGENQVGRLESRPAHGCLSVCMPTYIQTSTHVWVEWHDYKE